METDGAKHCTGELARPWAVSLPPTRERRAAIHSYSYKGRDLCGRDNLCTARRAVESLDEAERRLVGLLRVQDYEEIIRLAVVSRKNILISGASGSGKTTWTNALIREIPQTERLITIEDTQELVLDRHVNHVRLLYGKDGQGLGRVSPKQLLEAGLRMKPDRILLPELRAEEAFDYLRHVSGGHRGSITTVRAASPELAFEQLVLLVMQSAGGREFAPSDIRSLLHLLVDVVIQCGTEQHERYAKIWYEPAKPH
jgi:type IV secretion system protein VirB11